MTSALRRIGCKRLCSVHLQLSQPWTRSVSGLQILKTNQNADKPLADVKEAVSTLKLNARAKFDETMEIIVRLGVDPRKPNQSVRGVVQLPHGTGKSVRVAVFAKGEKADEAKEAGAHLVGAEDLVEKVQAGEIAFDRCVATPDMMPLIGKIARILGPRGLMPNPKLGTVTPNVADAVKASKGGQVEFRAERQGIVHAGIGKVSFADEALLDNIKAFLIAISQAKPKGAKGQYIQGIHLTTTMGKGMKLKMANLNPQSARFMADV